MTESSENSGVFESFDLNGESEIEVIAGAAGDTQVVFDYGGNLADVVITYNNASIEIDDVGVEWSPTEVATFTIVDPDANKNPTEQDELEVGDETDVIPTIKMGSPLTLAGGSNPCLSQTSDDHNNLCRTGLPSGTHWNVAPTVQVGGDEDYDGANPHYGVDVYNVTDNSERLRLIHNGTETSMASETSTWINVTTGHTRADIVALAGTVVLSYDVSGPAALMSPSDINVYVIDSGSNHSKHRSSY